jgi:hypothetical protein
MDIVIKSNTKYISKELKSRSEVKKQFIQIGIEKEGLFVDSFKSYIFCKYCFGEIQERKNENSTNNFKIHG